MSNEDRNFSSDSGTTRREFLKTSGLGSIFIMLAPRAALPAPSDQQTELQSNWRIISAGKIFVGGEKVSLPSFDASSWHPIRQMPATVLQALQDAGVYKDLYFGMNLTESVPADLWKQDWWYRTTFDAPTAEVYSLIFNGINYRADVWLNGHLIADNSHVVGMYNSFEFVISKYINRGSENVLAVKVTPERKILDVDGVELADSWLDWINWKYFGYYDAKRKLNVSFLPDRNAGVWQRVFLSATGKAMVRNLYVATDLPLPATSPASLTVYCNLRNGVSDRVTGTLRGEISRPGKPLISFRREATLEAEETREYSFTPAAYPQLNIPDPDLWWPYQWGEPALYKLTMEFQVDGRVSDSASIHFGIRKVTQHRDSDSSFPGVGGGGNFWLQVNGRDFLIRGACYTPDLLFKSDPDRDRVLTSYAKDLGLNMLRWESKLADDSMLDRCDHEGIPVMQGWMCCQQWEHWEQWDAEDQWVARASLRARINNLRHHAAAFIWANGSDGRPPDPVRSQYHQILSELHWQNAVVDTVSHYKKDAQGNILWDGIHMLGPYSWRPPYYWFSGRFPAAQGSCAEQGDNESIPLFESLKKFIPRDKLWPVNEYWHYHAGAVPGNSTLRTIQKVIEKRYGPPTGAEDFCKKAQLAHYENTRAQFENFAANAWSTHKMTLYWMFDSHWPSFYGHLIDAYLNRGGAYFGAKKGLSLLNLVFDYYATGDRFTANIYVVNQTLQAQHGLRAAVRFYNLDGTVKFSKEVANIDVEPLTRTPVLAIPHISGLSSTYFVRCQLSEAGGAPIVDNVYWQSTTPDDPGNPHNDQAFILNQVSWADFTALNTMPRAEIGISASLARTGDESRVTITLTNPSDQVAFFLRIEVTKGPDGEEILPITYKDNYITVFSKESQTLWAKFRTTDLGGAQAHLRVEGYNVNRRIAAME